MRSLSPPQQYNPLYSAALPPGEGSGGTHIDKLICEDLAQLSRLVCHVLHRPPLHVRRFYRPAEQACGRGDHTGS